MNKTVKLLFYCTVAKPNLYMPYEYEAFDYDEASRFYLSKQPLLECDVMLNGKIVAEAECELVELRPFEVDDVNDEAIGYMCTSKLEEKACLTYQELEGYGNGKDLYFIHLKNVKPFEIPKELSDYYNKKPLSYDDWLYGIYSGGAGAKGNYESYLNVFKIKRASQNMMYAYDIDGNIYVLISIQSPYMCDIMNGKKTIEVRASILNALKELIK